MMTCKKCLNSCYGEGCCIVDFEEIRCLLYYTKIYIADRQAEIIKALKWTTRDHINKFMEAYKEIKILFNVLKEEWEAYKLGFRSCLCDKELCNLKDLLRTMLPPNCQINCESDQIIVNG